MVDVLQLFKELRTGRVRIGHDADHATGAADGAARLRAGEHTALAVRTNDGDRVALAAEAANLRRRAGDVEHRERDTFIDVLGEARPERALEKNRGPRYPEATRGDIDALHALDAQRGQRQRDQRRDAIARPQVEPIAQRFADLQHAADEHAAAAGDGVVLLAAQANDFDDVIGDARRIASARVRDLLEGGRIDVERVDGAEDFIDVDLRRGVEPPRLLRHRAGRLDHAVGPQRTAQRLHLHKARYPTVTPPRSKGIPSTIVVRVRAIPGVAFRRASSSSR